MKTSETPILESDDQPVRFINSTDATIGLPIVERVQIRQKELEALRDGVDDKEGHLYQEITLALDTVHQLLSGDLVKVSSVVLADMNRWLERNKHVAESAVVPPEPVSLPVPDQA